MNNPNCPHSPDYDSRFEDGPIYGAMSIGEALESAGEPTNEANDGSMFADPEPTVQIELQEGLFDEDCPSGPGG